METTEIVAIVIAAQTFQAVYTGTIVAIVVAINKKK